jgi:hypothetical protein
MAKGGDAYSPIKYEMLVGADPRESILLVVDVWYFSDGNKSILN